jgi:hypothetical protein
MGVDPKKIEIVKSCLEISFKDIRHRQEDGPIERFAFNDGKESSDLVFNRAFIDDIPEDRLKSYMEKNIVPTLKANPGKRISVSTGGIGVSDKDSN